jgi:hypothetical protein
MVMEIHHTRDKLDVRDATVANSHFDDVNLSNTQFHNVNLSASAFEKVLLSNARIADANMSGMLLSDVNLSNVRIENAQLAGMTINGVSVTIARRRRGLAVSWNLGCAEAGLDMMRLAGIAYHERNYAEASRIWDQYRTRFPRGAHALEATYWAGRARDAAGKRANRPALDRDVERDAGVPGLHARRRAGSPGRASA